IIDDFETLSGWTTSASEGSGVRLSQELGRSGMAMRIDFELSTGGYVIVRKNISLVLPENYAFTFDVRGDAPRNTFEFKLVDLLGKGVWWRRERDFSFHSDWQRVTIRKSRLEPAWGERDLQRVGAIELAISAGGGGSGTVWIDDLAFE